MEQGRTMVAKWVKKKNIAKGKSGALVSSQREGAFLIMTEVAGRGARPAKKIKEESGKYFGERTGPQGWDSTTRQLGRGNVGKRRFRKRRGKRIYHTQKRYKKKRGGVLNPSDNVGSKKEMPD